MRLKDRVALITGAGDGIGRAIARCYAGEGARVALTGRRAEKLDETAELVGSSRADVLTLPGDVSLEADVRKAVEAVVKRFGRLDILVNNAGIIGPTEAIEKISTAEWDDVLAINLRGPFLTCREALPHMLRADSGCIINIASIAGRIAYPARSPYAASKWGLIGFTRTLALEVIGTNIRVNTVCPGAILGERLASVIQAFGKFTQGDEHPRLKKALSYVKASKLLPPEEIASVCLFLASDEAVGISGQEIVVAGVTG